MRFTIRQWTFSMLSITGFICCTFATVGIGQVATSPDTPATRLSREVQKVNPSEIKSLDHVRQLGAGETDANVLFVSGLSLSSVLTPPDPRKEALKKIELAKARLNANEDRSEVEPLLKAALAEYFIADMRHRVRELDDIKAKIAESEAKLQKRLDSQQESVDLQLRIMLREADGQGFFRQGDTPKASSFRNSGPVRNSAPATSHFPGSVDLKQDLKATNSEIGFSPRNGKQDPISPELKELTKALSNTQTLVIVAEDQLWEHYRLPSSFDDQSYSQLAGAILRALGSEADSANLLRDRNSAELHVKFSMERFEQVGKTIPNVIEVLKKSSDQRQKQKEDSVTQELLAK